MQNAKNASKNSNFFSKVRSVLPQSSTAFGERKPWYKLPLARRIIYFVLSLLIAVFLWGYAVMTQNPDRTKTFSGIKPYFESGAEADLIQRKLTITSDLTKVLDEVSVTVSAPLTEVSKMDKNDIVATISLNGVSQAGTYRLEIKAAISNSRGISGTVLNVEPSTVEITVDDLVSHTVPITYDYTGELPEGYWHDTPTFISTTTTIEGAKSDLINVSSAVCHIDLTDLTESLHSSIPLSIQDSDGNEIDKSVFRNVIPAVTVNMKVLPHKLIPIIPPEIIETELQSDIFEIAESSLTVEYLDIAAEAKVLEKYDQLTCEPVRLSGVTEPKTYIAVVTLDALPENCIVLGGVDPSLIQFRMVIVEKQVEQTFVGVPITVVGWTEGFKYSYNISTVDVKITGPARLVQGFVSSDLTIELNVKGKGEGEYDIELEYTLSDFELFAELNIEFLTKTVHVVIVPMGEV